MAASVQTSMCKALSTFKQVLLTPSAHCQRAIRHCRSHSTVVGCYHRQRVVQRVLAYQQCNLSTLSKDRLNGSVGRCKRFSGLCINNVSANVKFVSTSVKTDKGKLAKAMPMKRSGRKKQLQEEFEDTTDYRNVVAYAVGEELNLDSLSPAINKEGVYDLLPLPNDIMDCLMVTANFRVNGNPREAFFFSDGGLVCWNMSESERHELVRFTMKHASRPYNMDIITGDSEIFNVHYDKKSGIVKETIHLKTPDDLTVFNEELALHKFAFSNALSQSVNVSVNESNLDTFIEQLEPETQRLRFGQNSRLKKRDIEMKQGEVFLLRHEINLETGLLDTPDIYWERDELETLYRDTINYLMIPKRIRVINERLTYCSEILSLFSDQINDRHHIRLEWIIIILIFIEVIFGIIHLGDRYVMLKEEAKADTGTGSTKEDPKSS